MLREFILESCKTIIWLAAMLYYAVDSTRKK